MPAALRLFTVGAVDFRQDDKAHAAARFTAVLQLPAADARDYDTGVGQANLDGALITTNEKARFATSVARPNLRFHYRFLAVDEATHAADLLPPRSQAFAAV